LLPSTRTEPLCCPSSNHHPRPIFGDNHTASSDCVAYIIRNTGTLGFTRAALLKILLNHHRFGVIGMQKAAEKVQKEKTVAWKLAKGGFIYYCRADSTCSKFYTTPGGANRHMTTNHKCKDPSLLFALEKKQELHGRRHYNPVLS
jgi:hypothetical protein